MATAARPSCARATLRGRGPGSNHCQPSRMPAPAATNTAVSSSSPCGAIRPKNTSPRPLATISPPTIPTLMAFWASTYTAGSTKNAPAISTSADTQALLVQTWAANPAAASEE